MANQSRAFFIPLAGGGGGTAGKAVFAFVNADLVAGVFTAVHNLAQAYVISRVYDNNDIEVLPDDNTIVDANTLDVTLASFQPLPGVWHLVVVG